MTFKDAIDTGIKVRMKTYKDEPAIFKALYLEERRLIDEYNGRQLLEMLQNADDAGADKVLIEWDKKQRTLRISNTGNSFSVEGVESLMLPNNSSKTGKVFIGNKGLGFRSILYWADLVRIYTNQCQIEFSEKIAAEIFNEKLNLSDETKIKLRNDSGLNSIGTPFPTLGIPKVTLYQNQHWSTTIHVDYKAKYENSIEKQIQEVTEEILLFLNNITSLVINVDGNLFKKIDCSKDKIDAGPAQVQIGQRRWMIFESGENMLPEKYQKPYSNTREYYSLKIAISEGLQDSYKRLFNFFPTKVTIDLPCLIHGTFDLSSNRDHLNQSPKNDYIMSQLPSLFMKCIEFLKKENLSWLAFRLIYPGNQQTDSSEVKGLYERLTKLRDETLAICPTIRGRYVTFPFAKYYGNSFSAFAQEHLSVHLGNVVIPIPDNAISTHFSKNIYETKQFVALLDAIPAVALSIEHRAELIHMLTLIPGIDRVSLLVDKEETVISKNEVSFTPRKQSDEEYATPGYSRIHFMNNELYGHLLKLVQDDLDPKERDRELKRRIDKVVNVQPYDSATILERIVTRTRFEVDRASHLDQKISIVKEMVSKLFINYSRQDADRRRTEKLKYDVPLLSEQNMIVYSRELFLSKSYRSGHLTEMIYGDKLNGFYLLKCSNWMLGEADPDLIEEFFLWLGVNKFSRTNLTNIEVDLDGWKYIEDASLSGYLQIPIDYRKHHLNGNELLQLQDMDRILSLSAEKILLLCLSDTTIRTELERRNIEISWLYNRSRKTTLSQLSYIRHQFIKSGLFSKLVIDDTMKEINTILNKNSNIDYTLFKSMGYDESEVTAMLVRLGAHNSIDSLSPESLYDILRAISTHYDHHRLRGIQGVYKMVADALEEQKSQLPVPGDLMLFAKKNGENILLPSTEIYYSNNHVLPVKIMDTLPVLNYPKRSGENKLKQYFGINIIDGSHVKLNADIQMSAYSSIFSAHLERMKPFLLTYRLYSRNLKKEIISREVMGTNASQLKNCTIILVDHCSYSYGNSGEHLLETNDFIYDQDVFYLKPPKETSFQSLLLDSGFSDAFAEIISILFNVSELKNDFRALLRNDIEDSRHLISKDFDEDKLNKIQDLMGLPHLERKFWDKIFTKRSKVFSTDIITSHEVVKAVNDHLGIDLPNYYSRVNFEVCNNEETYLFIKFITEKLNLEVSEFYPSGVMLWHREKLIDIRYDYENNFKALLWDKLNNNKHLQEIFLALIDDFKLEPISEFIPIEYANILNVDYKELLRNQVIKKLGIDLGAIHTQNFNPISLYKTLFENYDVTSDEIPDKIKSLTFFPDNETLIEKYLKERQDSSTQPLIDQNNNEEGIVEILSATLEKPLAKVASNTGERKNKRKRMVHSKKLDELKHNKGKKAEEFVFNEFCKLYGEKNVHWVSSNSDILDRNDNLQYDIKYRDENGSWKYVEVKSLSDNSFVLTQPEKEYGIKMKNKYELALVENKRIYRVYGPFNFSENESFESNKSFSASPKEYIINFKVMKLEQAV